jgi:zinc transport system ATP-binding protein
MNTIIKANKVCFSYAKQSLDLTDVSFEVYENDYIGLIGPNGGGKSTLLKIILGLLVPDSGSIVVFGSNNKSVRDKIGYVPQYSKIDLDYPISVWEVVMSGFLGNKKLGSLFNHREKDKAKEVLEDLKLFHRRNCAIGELSGGQRQRIMIARALVREPKLLLLDEPTSSVDEESGRNLYDLLQNLNNKMAIITVSHDVDMISRHVRRIFCLNNKMVCNDATDITNGNIVEDMKKILHDDNCIIH